jgi:hypothetical protein
MGHFCLRFAPAQAYRRRASASLRQKSAFLLGDRIWIITQQQQQQQQQQKEEKLSRCIVCVSALRMPQGCGTVEAWREPRCLSRSVAAAAKVARIAWSGAVTVVAACVEDSRHCRRSFLASCGAVAGAAHASHRGEGSHHVPPLARG